MKSIATVINGEIVEYANMGGGGAPEIIGTQEELDALDEAGLIQDGTNLYLKGEDEESGEEEPEYINIQEKFEELEQSTEQLQTDLRRLSLVESVRSIVFSSAGWYRIAKFYIDSSTAAKGASGLYVEFILKREYSNTNNEVHHFEFLSAYNKGAFKEISSVANVLGITKARYTVDVEAKTGYIEVYYNLNVLNGVVEIMRGSGISKTWSLIDPQQTQETVEGVTVMADMELGQKTGKLDAISDNPANFSTVADFSTGIYALGSSEILTLTDRPAGVDNFSYLFVMSTDSDQRVVLIFNPRNSSAHIKFQYGTWGGWKKLNLSDV